VESCLLCGGQLHAAKQTPPNLLNQFHVAPIKTSKWARLEYRTQPAQNGVVPTRWKQRKEAATVATGFKKKSGWLLSSNMLD
jgi:hypothetical protein